MSLLFFSIRLGAFAQTPLSIPLSFSCDIDKRKLINIIKNLSSYSNQSMFDDSIVEKRNMKSSIKRKKTICLCVWATLPTRESKKKNDESCTTNRWKNLCDNNNYSCLWECIGFLSASFSILVETRSSTIFLSSHRWTLVADKYYNALLSWYNYVSWFCYWFKKRRWN